MSNVLAINHFDEFRIDTIEFDSNKFIITYDNNNNSMRQILLPLDHQTINRQPSTISQFAK